MPAATRKYSGCDDYHRDDIQQPLGYAVLLDYLVNDKVGGF